MGKMWNELMRKYNITGSNNKPYHPQHKQSEESVQDIKRESEI